MNNTLMIGTESVDSMVANEGSIDRGRLGVLSDLGQVLVRIEKDLDDIELEVC